MNERRPDPAARGGDAPIPELILVLGAQNDPDGTLGANARARADRALELHRSRPGSALVLTGGRAPHFNVSRRPHAGWMAHYLVGRGTPATSIVGAVLSGNTVEDALFARELVAAFRTKRLTAVTSQFHARRATLIFRAVFPHLPVEVIACDDALAPAALARRHAHEENAIAKLIEQRGILWHGQLLSLPPDLLPGRSEGAAPTAP